MRRTIKTTGENESSCAAICVVCGLNLTREHDWSATMPVYHCIGKSQAGQPHHSNAPTYGNCWKCAKPLGCGGCGARSIGESFCWRCKVWGTKEAFVEQGLLGGQTVEQYPAGWHHDYYAARAFRTGSAR
jgi:hypothetical protein